MDRQGIIDLAVQGTELVKQGLDGFGSNVTFEYSPESFTGTELDFASEICAAVADTWGATPEAPMIINLPSTVEMATRIYTQIKLNGFVAIFHVATVLSSACTPTTTEAPAWRRPNLV